MNRLGLIYLLLLFAAPAHAADIGVSISVADPGFYGRIDIGGAPHPEVIYAEPVQIVRPRARVAGEPLYLHVPPGQAKNWRKYCREYGACSRPVFFVREAWYRDVYVPHHRARNGRHDERRGTVARQGGGRR